MTFGETVRKIGSEFLSARTQTYAKHPLAQFIRHDWPNAAKGLLSPEIQTQFQFDASAGNGQWNAAPWLAVLHPLVTKSAQAGFYPVYLFEPNFETVCLVMGQGAERLESAIGKKAALQELSKRAETIRLLAKGWQRAGFVEGPFRTLRQVSAPKHGVDADPWAASVAFGVRYHLSSLPSDEVFARDLSRMLDLYSKLSSDPTLAYAEFDDEAANLRDSGELPEGGLDGAKKVVEHKRFEKRKRNAKLIGAVKRNLGYECQACRFSFAKKYGDHMARFIEAHHVVPISTLGDEGAVLSPTEEHFTVLCSNCHRAIHAAGCPSLEQFRASLKS